MGRKSKIGRNDSCPCGSGHKYKTCCEGKVDWNEILKEGLDGNPYLSIRGRNIQFIEKIAEALEMDPRSNSFSTKDKKAAFTSTAVTKIHQALMEMWPLDMDIKSALSKTATDVSGLYVGDYGTKYILKGLARHSIYSNKMLVVDPFVYPTSVREEFNPLFNPQKYRSQTLINVNFWFSLYPWIKEGIVEIIRTPADFDSKLNWESLKRQEKKFEENKELKQALEISISEQMKRHLEEEKFLHTLSAPNEYLEQVFNEQNLAKDGFTTKDFIEYIERVRAENPDFLEPLSEEKSSDLRIITSGTSYDIAKLTANLTDSYLVTDIYSKWKEIEVDRDKNNANHDGWAPFAKAFQEIELKYLNSLKLDHALTLRKEKRLESMRVFLRKVWKAARTPNTFNEANVRLLSEELGEEIKIAEEEWKQIDRELLKWFGAELGAGFLAAGPLIASGHGHFLAAAMASAAAIKLGVTQSERKSFQTKFPAAFFLKLK